MSSESPQFEMGSSDELIAIDNIIKSIPTDDHLEELELEVNYYIKKLQY